MNKRQAKKQYKKIHGHNPPKTAVTFSGLKVPFVAVYGHPDDFPDKYVARIYELDRATDTIMVKETLEEIEMDIKEHTAMTFIQRGTADVPSLVGVWM